ncbi:MAG: homoserine dehydrogenase [Myxococcota bacterium]|jgi:homoserine dehydrogenase|nr:homoserine dehydrogenase [Myxococcota bacterium]
MSQERQRSPVRIGLLGCGVVGGGVLRLLNENRSYLELRVGAPLEVRHVLVRDPKKPRVAECRAEWVTTDPEVIFKDEQVDLVVEVMGGETPAHSYLQRAIAAGKGVVSANKLLIAKHGPELVQSAISRRVDLAFEASVGGGIPIIRTLREALASDSVSNVHAILNGTCNYILTRMRDAGLGFDQALAEAQKLGYAEADPTLDVDGHDAAQKLVVISMLAFDARIDPAAVHVEGIRTIDAIDFRFADRFGFTVKHLGIGHERGEKLELRVHPALISKHSVLANVDGVLNAVFLNGRALGPCLLVGRGAGDMPTAVSVVADLVDVARSRLEGEPGLRTRSIQLSDRELVPRDDWEPRYYLRFDVGDHPGVVGTIASALGGEGVSIEHMVQDGRASTAGDAVPVCIVTHESREGSVRRALETISRAPFMKSPPRLIRIEDV